MFQHKRWLAEVVLFLTIIALVFASRFWLIDLPNFKPVAALVLFGAFFFRRSWVAVFALVVVMLISDLYIGVYEWPIAISVYLGLGAAGLLGFWVKRSCQGQRRGSMPRIGAGQTWRFGVASIAMSTAFFVLTNAAVWMSGWYPPTLEGGIHCYTAAIPFYRATLAGDFLFTVSLVGAYQVCCYLINANLFSGAKTKSNLQLQRN